MMDRCPRALALAFVFALAGCGGTGETSSADHGRNVFDVSVRDRLAFDAPDSVSAGWVTFRLHNESGMTHFALIERQPEGIGIREQQTQVAPVFQAGMDLLSAGKVQQAMAKFGELPAWTKQTVFLGGPGLTGPQHTSETTVNLQPGRYMLECYVKTNGVFHSYSPDSTQYGMVHQFVVTAPPSPAPAPQPTLRLTLSSTRGIEVSGDPQVGEQIVAVRFEDQKAHENFVGHDVHLVRLADSVDTKALVAWMDWTRKGGLQTPAPAEFLGGVNEMPAGSTGYLTVTLEPGRYAWIAEVPKADEQGMLREFTIPGDVPSGG